MLYQVQTIVHDKPVPKRVGADIARKANTPKEIFGAAITHLRVTKGKTQAAVAAGVGCEEFYLRNIERGKENFSFDIMFAIVDYFEMLPLSRFWHLAEKFAEASRRNIPKSS